MLTVDVQQIVRNLEILIFCILRSATGFMLAIIWTSDPQKLGQYMVLKHFTTNTLSESTTS